MHDRPAFYVNNHDGDSVTVVLDQDFFDMKRINIRLANVWAPELGETGGLRVTQFVQEWCERQMKLNTSVTFPLVVHTQMNSKGLAVKSFDRYIATIMSKDGKECLNADVMKFIVENNYTGGIGSISRPKESAK